VRTECATLEGGDRALFETLSKELHWEASARTGAEKTATGKPASRRIAATQSPALVPSVIRQYSIAGEIPKLPAVRREPLDRR
jgi:hypothetical protein